MTVTVSMSSGAVTVTKTLMSISVVELEELVTRLLHQTLRAAEA